MAESKKKIREREERKKKIIKARDESGYLDFEQFYQFLNSKGIYIEKNTKNMPRFARNHSISTKRFGRIGKKGGDPAYYKKPSPEKIETIKKDLKETNNSYLGRKFVKEKEKLVIHAFNQAEKKDKRDEENRLYRQEMANQIAKENKIKINRAFIGKVIRENYSKKEMKEKLNRPVINQQPTKFKK